MPSTLIVRLPNWLGDTVMAVPLVRALRTAWPRARLILVGPWSTLVEGQGLADEVMDYPRSWRARLRARAPMRAMAADLAVMCPNSLESAVAARSWGARRRVGFASQGRACLLTDVVALPSPRRHQIDEYLMLLEPLGVPVVTTVPVLAPPAAESPERAAARALLAEHGADLGTARPVVGIHLGAAWGSSKLWPPDRVRELGAGVRNRGGTAVLLGTPADRPRAEAIGGSVPVVDLVGRDTPGMLPALLAELDILVCADTGVGHLAAALGTSVVALFGPTDPGISAPRGPAVVVRHEVPCAPCYLRTCPIEHPCMRDLEAHVVLARLEEVAARWSR